MVVSDVPCPNAVDRYASNDDVRRAYHAPAVAVDAACLHWPEFAVPTRHSSARPACRDVSRNKFTKVEVASAPSLAKLYGPDTRRMRTRLGIMRVIMLCVNSYSSVTPDVTLSSSMAACRTPCVCAASCASVPSGDSVLHVTAFDGMAVLHAARRLRSVTM